MNRIQMEIPFLLLSFRVNTEGELEKRFLTPFGLIDVIFRKTGGIDHSRHVYDIEVEGDTDSWVSVEPVAIDFKEALLKFIMGIVEKDLGKYREPLQFEKLIVRIRGAETNLSLPPGPGSDCDTDGVFRDLL